MNGKTGGHIEVELEEELEELEAAAEGPAHAFDAAELGVKEEKENNEVNHSELLTLVVGNGEFAGAGADKGARSEWEREGQQVVGVHLHEKVLEETQRGGELGGRERRRVRSRR